MSASPDRQPAQAKEARRIAGELVGWIEVLRHMGAEGITRSRLGGRGAPHSKPPGLPRAQHQATRFTRRLDHLMQSAKAAAEQLVDEHG